MKSLNFSQYGEKDKQNPHDLHFDSLNSSNWKAKNRFIRIQSLMHKIQDPQTNCIHILHTSIWLRWNHKKFHKKKKSFPSIQVKSNKEFNNLNDKQNTHSWFNVREGKKKQAKRKILMICASTH